MRHSRMIRKTTGPSPVVSQLLRNDMNRCAKRHFRRFHGDFAKRRMGMDRQSDVFRRHAGFNGEPKLGDHVRSIWTDDLRTNDDAVLFADNELQEAVRIVQRQGAAVGSKREFRGNDVNALVFACCSK